MKKRYGIYLLIAVCYLAFAGIVFTFTWHTVHQKPWSMNTDIIQFGNIINRALNPDLFSTDFAFATNRYTDFYTPSFIQVMVFLTSITGDYVKSLGLIQLPLIIAYFFCGHLVYFQFTRSHVISIIFVLLSIIGIGALNSEWEVSGLYWMVPRTLALPAMLISFFVLLRLFDQYKKIDISYRQWFIMGATIGITANFHPTTGMTLAMVVGVLALVHTLKSGKPGWGQIIVLVIGTVVAAIPTVLHVVSNSNIGNQAEFVAGNTGDFRRFAEVFEWRIRAYPFTQEFGRGWTIASENMQFLIRFPWLPLTLASWFVAKVNNHSKSALLFMAIQIVYIWLVIDNIDQLVYLLLIGYTVYKWVRNDDARVFFMYEIIAGIFLVALALPLIFRPLWYEFELWSLSTVVIELSRVSRQLHIPFTLILAGMATDLWNQWQTEDKEQVWMRVMLVVSSILGFSILIAVGVANLVYGVLHRTVLKPYRWIRYAIVGVFCAGLTAYTATIILPWISETDRLSATLLLQPSHFTVLVGVLIAVVIWTIITNFIGNNITSQMIALTVGILIASAGQYFLIADQSWDQKNRDFMELAEWAKNETPIDALFVVYANDVDRGVFRLFSQRSIHFSRKELNIIGYAHPEDLVAAHDRYQEYLNYPPLTEDNMIYFFDDQNADYVVWDSDPLEESEHYKLIHEIGRYTIYAPNE